MSLPHDHHSCGCGCGGGSLGAASRDWAAAPDAEIICPCLGLSKGQVLAAIQAGAYTLPLLKVMTGAGRGRDCAALHPLGRSCQADLDEMLRLYAQAPLDLPGSGCGH